MSSPAASPPQTWRSEACAAALAGLPGMTTHRLRHLLDRWPPEEAWQRVLEGADLGGGEMGGGRRIQDAVHRWRAAARGVDLTALWSRHQAAGVSVTVLGEPSHPPALSQEPDPAPVLFHRGLPVAGPTVAIVGTRRCTYGGRVLARELGADLAAAGVSVVSGLALGIDGAAHVGALSSRSAPPVGVVGTGLDVVYPRRHADLWAAVGETGWLLSEYPLGTGPEPWRFPARNRLIAGLADLLVVVESHRRGGSLHTVEAAIERGVTVMAVPGSVRTSAAAGTNDLLASGCPPVRDATDVLVALGLEAGERRGSHGGAPAAGVPLEPEQAQVLDALGSEAATLEQVAVRSGGSIGATAVHLQRLVAARVVVEHDGWFERA